MKNVDFIEEVVGNVDSLNKYYNSSIRIFRQNGKLPAWIVDMGGASGDSLAIVTLMALIQSKILACQFAMYDVLSSELPFIQSFVKSRPRSSFTPMLLDLVNIKFALNEFSPDLILEIGGGVSSSLFARYSQCQNIPYFLVDPDKNWAENTIDILKNISGVSAPRFLDLPIIQKDRDICIQLGDGTAQTIKSNPEFDYENNDLIRSLELSKKPLIYLDGAPKGARFMGAEFILDNNLKSLLSGGVCLLDCRSFAAILLSTYASKTLYSTIAYPMGDGTIPKLWKSWAIFEDLSFSAFEI